MSIKIMTAVWTVPNLSVAERLILLAYADFADDNGVCWPKQETIAARCNISRRYVARITEALTKRGLMVHHRRGMTSSEYRLLLCEPEFISDVNQSSNICEPEFISNVNQSSLKPPINHQEPSMNHHIKRVKKQPTKQAAKEKPKRERKVELRDPLLDNQAVIVYKSVMRTTPNDTQRKAIATGVENLDTWRAALEHWKEHGWNIRNVTRILSFYRDGGAASCSSCNHNGYKRPVSNGLPINPETGRPEPAGFPAIRAALAKAEAEEATIER